MATPTTFGSLQSALLEGLARAAPGAARAALPHLLRLLGNLDRAWPVVVIAGRALELLLARSKLPTPEAIAGAIERAAREFAQTELAKYWMKQPPLWKELRR